MSYSRWGNSYWYTYWHVYTGEDVENRNNAILDICCVMSFTADQIRKNINLCLGLVKEKEPKGDIEELRIYMKRFLNDVDDFFDDKKQKKIANQRKKYKKRNGKNSVKYNL